MERISLTPEEIMQAVGDELDKFLPPHIETAKAQLKKVTEKLPMKITTIGEERSVPSRTQIRFLFEGEWQALLKEANE